MQAEDFELVELTPWVPPATSAPLREVAFNARAWLPEDDRQLREFFAADTPIEHLAWIFDRSQTAVRDRLRALGLRRRSALPWNELEDEELARRYGVDSAADIARDLGRLVSAIYNRAAFLGLTEGNPPPWSEWEDAQLREGYARGVPLPQLARLIGRPLSGLSSRADALGIRHANKPDDWSDAEAARALELAQTGMRYLAIIEQLVAEGFPRRSKAGFGPKVRKLGYGRGWGRSWTPEEDDLLRKAYAAGDSLRNLGRRLDRPAGSLRYRAEELGLRGTHPNHDGFRQGPVWTEADEQVLRREFGRTCTRALAGRLGRTRSAVLVRANVLGLVHGMHKAWTDQEAQAIAVAWRIGIGLTDLGQMFDRDPSVVMKYARRLGFSMSDPARPVKPPRGPRAGRAAPTLEQLLAQATEVEASLKALPLKSRGGAAPPHPKRKTAR